MNHRRAQIILVAFVVATVVVFLVVHKQPRYEGRRLTDWLSAYRDNLYGNGHTTNEEDAKAAEHAIKMIGTNGIPELLKLASSQDSELKASIIALMKYARLPVRTDSEKRSLATFGFHALGSIGKDAVPPLIELLGNTNVDTRLTASDCLGNIGPDAKDAVPILLQSINNTDRLIRFSTTANLGKIHMHPELVVPVLITNLSSSNVTRPTTVSALGQFGPQAKSAVAALLPLLNDSDSFVREAATNALKQIEQGK